MQNYSSKERLISAVGYVGILFLLPMFNHENSKFVKFHGKQSFSLFLAWIINSIIMMVPILGWLVGFFGTIFLTIIMIIAILKAYAGEEWEIPFISKISEKLNI